LKDGAKIVETADDILEELGLAAPQSEAPKPARGGAFDPVLASLVAGESSDVDSIAERSGLSIARVLPRLLELELDGLVRRAGGGRFIRI
jgi:DNA processing protein